VKPLCIDLFCGLGGWAHGFLAEGYDVVGFDIERHQYGKDKYPAQIVLQDVLTLHGSQFRKAAVIVASPPCQAYSKRAMPFGGLWLEHNRMDDDGGPPGNYRGKDPIFNDLFRACFRIAREADVPIIVENVKGAQKFVGPAAWRFGSYYLWGDIPALMPMTFAAQKFNPDGTENGPGSWFKVADSKQSGVKCAGQKHGTEYAMTRGPVKNAGNGTWFNIAHGKRIQGNQSGAPQRGDGLKFGGGWHDSSNNLIRKVSSKSPARKAASAQIAKIPFPLAQHIARVFKPANSYSGSVSSSPEANIGKMRPGTSTHSQLQDRFPI
jgi:C-5 cytosine-specific DNA methylase